jgi:hypothetical protein
MRRPWRTPASTLAAVALAIAFIGAQSAKPPTAKPARAAAARDLSGVWMPSSWYHLMGGGDPGNLPRNTLFSFPAREAIKEREALLTPWGRERLAAWTPESDPDARCLSPGAVRSYQSPYPIEFLHTTGRVTILYEYEHLVRRIYTDGRGHPQDLDPTAMGHSTGRWDGDTLVIDTVGLADTTLLNTTGLPHSDRLHLTERIRRILDGTVLEIEFTIDDQVAYSKPWKATSYFKRDPAAQIMEYNCDLVVDYRKVP